jgi:hypothetical protein
MSCACDIGLFLSGSRSAAVTEQSWLHVLKMVESVTRAGMGTIGFLPFWSSQSSSQYMQAGGKLFGSWDSGYIFSYYMYTYGLEYTEHLTKHELNRENACSGAGSDAGAGLVVARATNESMGRERIASGKRRPSR